MSNQYLSAAGAEIRRSPTRCPPICLHDEDGEDFTFFFWLYQYLSYAYNVSDYS
jgi:hypothetical protein